MTLGDTIKDLRNKRGLTQSDLANDLGVSHSSVAMWETSKRDMDTKMIVKVAKYFYVTCDFLLGADEIVLPETFGSRLRVLRGIRTQQEVADIIGVSRASYSHYENGHADPDFATLIKLVKLFEVTSDFLLGIEVKNIA